MDSYFYYNAFTIGIYYSPSEGVKAGTPWCVRLLKGDKEPFRHGLSLEDKFQTREDAIKFVQSLEQYFELKKEEQ